MFSQTEYQVLTSRAGLLDRSGRGRIQLTGADRRSYLHGLLTNDVLALSAGEGAYAALLTPQGRMISDMRVSELGASILIDLPASTAETVLQRLADFVFTEDVDVRNVQALQSQLSLYGPQAADVLAPLLTGPAGEEANATWRDRLQSMAINANAQWQFGGATVVVVRSDDYGLAGFELMIDAACAADLGRALHQAGAEDVSPQTLEVTRVEAGRPEFGVDMDEHTIPLEAGIEDRAISLTKGCYVGQEIIIRVLHRGHGRVAKRLVGLLGDPRDGGMARHERVQAERRDVGTVTSAVVSPRLGRPIGLGYVHRDYADPGTILQVGEPEAARSVTVVTLPFSLPAAR